MNRRQFAFWLGFGLFSLSDKLRIGGLDRLAAATMRATESKAPTTAIAKSEIPVHWTANDDKEWRWYERENYVDGQWKLTGTTAPINKKTGERKDGHGVYLDDSLLPEDMRDSAPAGGATMVAADADADKKPGKHLPTETRRGRHGRPPSKWLRSLHADELRIWLKTIDVPEAGVSGMTYWTHLTRDHFFDADKIEGLTEAEQAKLHAAAHFGY